VASIERIRRAVVLGAVCGAAWAAGAGPAEAQLGSLVSPGRLARPHASLEGLANCGKCHEQGRKVTAQKCLTCHQPIAERMTRKTGVHRTVTGDCVRCHVEHAGENGELRPFDTARFDHAAVTGFALDGKHAPVASRCDACHKARSFLTARAACASCHEDVHKPTLGQSCATCHSTRAAFREMSGFDHAKAAFRLAGAHRTVACAACHVNRVFKGVKFASCADCHRDPHRQTVGPACTSCHASDTWRTTKVDHQRTAFPLVGRHVNVACAACHKQPATKVKPRADTCAACHADVHRGTFRQDCKACHSENGFAKAPFDHGTTAFALKGRHADLACVACHKGVAANIPSARRVADFKGLASACASCHADVHGGELGPRCDTCHSSATFRVTGYVHPRFPEFFAGQHAPLGCDRCHAREAPTRPVRVGAPVTAVRFKTVSTACASCHRDVHLGQQGPACENCHTVQIATFGLAEFSHDRTKFPLTGRHQTVACAQCHKRETGQFPAGAGTAVRYKGIATECRACHEDVHLGQLDARCETCHTTASFKLPQYRHLRARSLSEFFVGRHARAICTACHKPATDRFPAGRGIAVRFKIETRCVACHADVHHGALGPQCADCHRP
jgi:hypothetical protein